MSNPDAERARLQAEIRDLQRRVDTAQAVVDREKAAHPGPRWGLIGLLLLVVAAIGYGVSVVTGSVAWGVAAAVLGVPLLVLLVIVVIAFVQESAANRERATQRTIADVRVVCDTPTHRLHVGAVPGDAAALWMCLFADYCVTRYSASQWSSTDPGAKAITALGAWLDAVEPGLSANAVAWPAAQGWTVVDEVFVQSQGASDVGARLVVGRSGPGLLASEVVGDLGRGDALAQTLPAVLSRVARTPGAAVADAVKALRMQHAEYVRRGSGMKQGAAPKAAVEAVPGLKLRVAREQTPRGG